MEKTKRFTWKAVVAVMLIAFVALAGGFFVGTNMAYPVGYNDGAKVGYNAALTDVAGLLQQKGITLDWNQRADGSYVLTVTTCDGQSAQAIIAVNLYLEWHNKDGVLLTSRGAGTFTTLGKNWTVAQLSNIASVVQGNTGVNVSQFALYLSDSTDMGGVSTTSEILPNEITNKGLERALATSKNWISTGVFNCTKTKTATDTVTPLGWGLNYAVYTNFSGKSLIAYDATPGAKAMISGDTLTETWTITIS